ncbi:unnamed protein product [Amaranthus hypochondriacus]
MDSERKCRVRECWKSKNAFEFQKYQKACCCFLQSSNGYPPQRSVHGLRAGHRGSARHPWWRGPREPPAPNTGLYCGGVISLFIDGIPKNISYGELKKVFSVVGMVVDSYISLKHRKNRKENFGFIRFNRREEAEKAVKRFNGQVVFGSRLRVSKAKYQKGGSPFSPHLMKVTKYYPVTQHIKLRSSHDSRRSDVVMGKQWLEKKVVDGQLIVPVLPSLQVPEVNEADHPSTAGKEGDEKTYMTVLSSTQASKTPNDKTPSLPIDAMEVEANVDILRVEDHDEKINKTHIKGPTEGGENGCVVNSERRCGPVPSNARGKVRKLLNTKEIALFLGYYSNGPKDVSHSCYAT